MHRYPELAESGEMRSYLHLLISGTLIAVSVIFMVLGFVFRGKLKRLEAVIEKELGEIEMKEK